MDGRYLATRRPALGTKRVQKERQDEAEQESHREPLCLVTAQCTRKGSDDDLVKLSALMGLSGACMWAEQSRERSRASSVPLLAVEDVLVGTALSDGVQVELTATRECAGL